jgi:hypothetical protein
MTVPMQMPVCRARTSILATREKARAPLNDRLMQICVSASEGFRQE